VILLPAENVRELIDAYSWLFCCLPARPIIAGSAVLAISAIVASCILPDNLTRILGAFFVGGASGMVVYYTVLTVLALAYRRRSRSTEEALILTLDGVQYLEGEVRSALLPWEAMSRVSMSVESTILIAPDRGIFITSNSRLTNSERRRLRFFTKNSRAHTSPGGTQRAHDDVGREG
jgi:hypothetical protein